MLTLRGGLRPITKSQPNRWMHTLRMYITGKVLSSLNHVTPYVCHMSRASERASERASDNKY